VETKTRECDACSRTATKAIKRSDKTDFDIRRKGAVELFLGQDIDALHCESLTWWRGQWFSNEVPI